MTMKLSDCYRILNVSPHVKWEEIKKSYHVLAHRYHPDLHPGNLKYESKFKEITLAFKILETHFQTRNPSAKGEILRQYNIRPEPSAMEGNSHPIQASPLENSEIDLPDSILEPSRRKRGIGYWSRKLQEILMEYERKIFLLDIKKEIRIDSATMAHGGVVRVRKGKESFQVKIPSGSWRRMALRIPEKGEPSLFGKKRGDLLLNIHVTQSNDVHIGDSMFFYDIKVPRNKILGSRVLTLDSVHGPIKFILPRNTEDGQAFVLKSKSRPKASRYISHIVTIHFTG